MGFQDQLSLNADRNYCRMLQKHSAILSTFIKLPFVFKTFVLSIFEWLLKSGFTIHRPVLNVIVQLSCGDRSLVSGMGHNLLPYFMYVNSKGSAQTEAMLKFV